MKTKKLATQWIPFFGFLLLLLSCQTQKPAPGLSEADKTAIADSAKAVVQKIVDLSNQRDFKNVFLLYSPDADAHFIENGRLFPSLDDMKKEYDEFGPMLESLENKVDRWDVTVLAADAVLINLPLHFSIKAKGRPEYQGTYVWSGVVQKRNGKWILIHSHESWLNFAEAMKAIMPETK